MFWTYRYHLHFVARLDCLAGKSRTITCCRPPLTKRTQHLQEKYFNNNQSSFSKSLPSLPTRKKLCLYRPYQRSSLLFHVFNEVFSRNNPNELLTRNFSALSWHRSLFQCNNDNNLVISSSHSRTNSSFVDKAFQQLPNFLAPCPQAVSTSSVTFTKFMFNNRFRPCYSSFIHTKFYGTQSKNSASLHDERPSAASFDSELKPNKTQSSPQTADLKEDIQTIPNLLTCCRMASAPFLSYLVLNGNFSWALGLLMFAGLTDLLDGYIARNFKNQNTMLGTALDPLADKILISFLTVSLAMVNLIPLPLLFIIIGRDLGLIGIFFYIRYISIPPPKTLKRYFDVTHATAEVSPSFLSKVNTAIQLSLLALSVAAPVFGFVDHILLQTLWYVTASTTVLSALGYVRERKKAIKILGENSNSN